MARTCSPAPRPRQAVVAMGDETNKPSAVTAALLVLACCHLALALSKLPPPHDDEDGEGPAARRVEPVGYLASLASTVLAAYVGAAAACGSGDGRRRRRRPSVEALLAEARRTWARPAATALYIELLTTAMASLLLTLGTFLGAAEGAGAAAAGLLAASGSVALVAWLGPVLFAHSDIACRVSLVVAAAEEEGYRGRAAVERAEALVAGAGRRVRGVAVGLVAGAIEQAPAWLCGDGAPAWVLGPAVLAAKVVAACACAAFYYDCRRRHDKISSSSTDRLKLESMAKCCQTSDWEEMVADESEGEQFGGAFECFRLT